jgi:hypothetical protein
MSDTLICSENECPVVTTGKCLNGFNPPSSCPHYGAKSTSQSEQLSITDQPADANTNFVSEDANKPATEEELAVESDIAASDASLFLYRAQPLSEDEASEITRRFPAKVIALAGLRECGKTTLLAEIIHGFQEKPMNDVWFAGSRTLRGFEERCYKARIESDNQTPQAGRTPGSFSTNYHHLRLRRMPYREPAINLLIADIPGEDCEDALQSQALVSNMHILQRAENLAIMFDCERLANPKQRESAIELPLQLLLRFINSGLAGGNQNLYILFSKWDCAIEADPGSHTVKFVEEIKTTIISRHTKKFASLSFHNIAARSLSTNVAQRFGLAELTERWVSLKSRDMQSANKMEFSPDTRYLSRFKFATRDKENE